MQAANSSTKLVTRLQVLVASRYFSSLRSVQSESCGLAIWIRPIWSIAPKGQFKVTLNVPATSGTSVVVDVSPVVGASVVVFVGSACVVAVVVVVS